MRYLETAEGRCAIRSIILSKEIFAIVFGSSSEHFARLEICCQVIKFHKEKVSSSHHSLLASYNSKKWTDSFLFTSARIICPEVWWTCWFWMRKCSILLLLQDFNKCKKWGCWLLLEPCFKPNSRKTLKQQHPCFKEEAVTKHYQHLKSSLKHSFASIILSSNVSLVQEVSLAKKKKRQEWNKKWVFPDMWEIWKDVSWHARNDCSEMRRTGMEVFVYTDNTVYQICIPTVKSHCPDNGTI